MTEAEKAAFELAARTCEISVSAWVRDRLRRAARTEL